MSSVLTVNIAHPRVNPDTSKKPTGIDKRPTDAEVEVRAPGPMRGGLGSGLVGDLVSEQKHHGGDDQAVYAYARRISMPGRANSTGRSATASSVRTSRPRASMSPTRSSANVGASAMAAWSWR